MTAPQQQSKKRSEVSPWSPWSIRPLFDRRFGPLFDLVWADDEVGGYTPGGDLSETDDEYLLELDLPGIEKKDVTIDVSGRRISVSGVCTEKERAGRLRHTTRTVGSFSYEASLPSPVDQGKASATLTDGVLRITLPKAAESKGTRIAIG
jgi:HSP20 family protein